MIEHARQQRTRPPGAEPAALARARRLIEPALRDAVDSLHPGVRRIAAYHLGWVDGDGRPVAHGGGKAIRATLAMLGAEAVDCPADLAIAAATAVELLHNFTLLHDDIMDGDATRRHRPTAWRVFGLGPALLAGDALLVRAVQVVQAAPGPAAAAAAELLTRTAMTLVDGQADDLATPQDLDGYRRMVAGKTGTLLACAMSLGPVLAGAPADRVAGLARVGDLLGEAFQMVDDVLGIWGSPDVTGKPAWSDLREGKRSLPILLALRSGTSAGDRLATLMTEPISAEEHLRTAADLVEAAGGRTFAEAEAADRVRQAAAALGQVPMPDPVRAEFTELAAYLTIRRR